VEGGNSDEMTKFGAQYSLVNRAATWDRNFPAKKAEMLISKYAGEGQLEP